MMAGAKSFNIKHYLKYVFKSQKNVTFNYFFELSILLILILKNLLYMWKCLKKH